MGIGSEDLRILLEYKKKYNFGKKCAVLGNCTFFGFQNASKDEFKRIMNFDEVHTFDINGNPDFKLDLQEDLPEKFNNYYDCVLDIGVMMCCFDVVSVWKNVLNMLNETGCIYHQSNLVGHFGRSFWSFSPSVFNEFYKANNFKDIDLKYLFKSGPNKEKWQNINTNCNYLRVSNNTSLTFVNNNCTIRHSILCDTSLSCFARRDNSTPFKKPIPEHYINTNGK
tara:strand:+ start:194 stop:865 length:672 start_codon:yes stop_codon:yes gene_type:complete